MNGCWPTTVEDEGAPCASQNLCVLEAFCSSGECKAATYVECAVSVCTKSGCEHQPAVGIACSDGNLCTAGDTCTAEGCGAGTPYTCPEGAWACLGDGNCGCIKSKNDSPEGAFYLFVHNSGSICAGEADFFTLYASPFNEITLTLNHASAQGDLGLSVVLSNGTTPGLTRSSSLAR